MSALARIRVPWAGLHGGAGVSTFYQGDTTVDLAPYKGFFETLKGLFPASISMSYPNAGDIIDDVTGDLTGAWSASSTANTTCTNTGVYAAPAGALVQWNTGFIVDSHRLRGRTFLVPVCQGQLQNDGTLESATPAFIKAAADVMFGDLAGTLRIWHRPRKASAGPPAVAQRDGTSAAVTSTFVPDKVVILRSRRD